ncbi:CBO0543 family protein [Bacillus dakarensis]|uniref:CBO0543 family protein n=1 Tax=Robertmurraya dakarensis TaxID=1926278 RepID=UPI0009818A2B|nr:CBO0543 family protein [Bacillus dakarensis]
MSRDKGILISIWFIMIILILKFIKKSEIKHGILAFQFKQMITWLVGLLVVEKGLIRYPVREFKKANKTSFTFEYFIYPACCAIFNVRYPENKGKGIKLLYYIFHAGIITIIEVVIERYTNLVTYIKWRWYWTFISIGLTYYISRLFYCWYFKDEGSNFTKN